LTFRLRFLVLVLALVLAPGLEAAPWQGFTALAASPDGRSLATGGRQGEVLWLEAATGEVRGRWSLGEGPVVALVFEPTRLGVATTSGMYVVELLDPEPRTPSSADALVPRLTQARARWVEAAPLLRGTTLTLGGSTIVGSTDGVITVTGPRPATWSAHTAVVTGLVVLPGPLLVSASFDGTLGLWDLDGSPRGRL